MYRSTCLCTGSATDHRAVITYSHETVFARFEGTVIARCVKCGLLKTFPPAGSGDFDPVQSRDEMYEDKHEMFAESFSPITDRILMYKPCGRVLDVGCSSGILLSLLKNAGYEVCGLEPNASAYRSARSKLGAAVHKATLAQYMKTHTGRYDVIVYNHVFEHIVDVHAELNLIKKALKKDGILIIGVPNVANVIFYMRQKYWESLMPGEHVWHFSAKYLTNLLKDHGLAVVDTSYNDHDRADYPLKKRIYFQTLSALNRVLHTGEAVLLVAKS